MFDLSRESTADIIEKINMLVYGNELKEIPVDYVKFLLDQIERTNNLVDELSKEIYDLYDQSPHG